MKVSKDRYITNIDIPIDEVAKLRLLYSKKRKTVPEWQKELGADIVINGAFFNLDSKALPIEMYKTDGEVLSESDWCRKGFGVSEDQKTVIFGDFNKYYLDFTCGFPVLINAMKKYNHIGATGLEGLNPRTVFSQTMDGYRITLVDGRQKDKPGMTLTSIADYLLNMGDVIHSANLDGGGSTCGVVNGEVVNSPCEMRKVSNVLAIWLKKDEKGDGEMKKLNIGLNIGHYGTKGAVGFLDEVVLNHSVYDALKPMLEHQGHTVIPLNVAKAPDYVYATDLANQYDLDIILSLHHNSAENETANGTEVVHYPSSEVGKEYAEKLSNAISEELGTENRGAKPMEKTIHILKYTEAPCVIVESCFVSNKEDCRKWDSKKIASAIASVFGEVERRNEFEEMVESLAKHISISDQDGLVEELKQNPNSRLYWIIKKCLAKLGG